MSVASSFSKAIFAPYPRVVLTLFRTIYCLVIAAQLLISSEFNRSVFKELYIAEFVGFLFTPVLILLVVSLIAVALGVMPRLFLWASLILYFLYHFPASYAYTPHYNIAPLYVLAVLALSSKESSDSLLKIFRENTWREPISGWSIQTIKLVIGLVYFAAFMAKLMNGGWGWFDGTVMQSNFLERYLVMNSEVPYILAHQEWLCILIGIGTMVFEGLFWAVIFFRRFDWMFGLSAPFFHAVIVFTMALNFAFYFAPSFLVFIPTMFILEKIASFQGLEIKKSSLNQQSRA